MKELLTYFPDLTSTQLEKFAALPALYAEWNSRVNVISRKDIDNIFEHHILHSLSIAKHINFSRNTSILDLGTGGGFPGIPLAIFFPHAHFVLADSIQKKINVVKEIAEELRLHNVTPMWSRAENIREKFDFIVSRAVAPIPRLIQWSLPLIRKTYENVTDNGLIYLKGGEVLQEINELPYISDIIPISDWFPQEYFKEKVLIHIRL